MASVGARVYNAGDVGRSPQWGPAGAKPLVRGSGAKLLKLTTVSVILAAGGSGFELFRLKQDITTYSANKPQLVFHY